MHTKVREGGLHCTAIFSEKSFSSIALKPTFVDTQIFSPIDIAVMLHPVEME